MKTKNLIFLAILGGFLFGIFTTFILLITETVVYVPDSYTPETKSNVFKIYQ